MRSANSWATTLVEMVLAFIGIEVGPMAMINKALDSDRSSTESYRTSCAPRRLRSPRSLIALGFRLVFGEEAIETIPSTASL